VAPQPDAAREVNAEDGAATAPGDSTPGAAGAPDGAPRRDEAAAEPVRRSAAVPVSTSGTETRAAERSVQRAAALAATEGFHPLRIRPYVAEPDGEAGETTVRPLLTPPADGGPATTDLGLFPAVYSGLEYPAEEIEPAALVAVGAGSYAEQAAAAARGRHRRRRRGLVVAAAAVAASALAAGAVAVTGQVMGDEPRTDRAMPPDQSSSMPDVELPTEVAGVTGSASTGAPRHLTAPSAAPASSAASPTAPPSAPATTEAASPSPAAPSATAGASDTPSPAATTPSATAPTTPADPTAAPANTGPQVLQEGDTGAAVADLQRRLIDVWVYHGRVDGDFDRGVQEAVAMFQIWYGVQGDPPGVYGARTRSVLEHQTD
jgi:hypothetical protein